MSGKQTTLDLNGPILSFIQQPQSAVVDHNATATIVGIATATFPAQTPANPALNTGTLSYKWYSEGFGALSDGPFRGATISGTSSPTLVVSGAKNPDTNRVIFYVEVDYVPSAYSQPVGSAVTAGTTRSTGNAINKILTSGTTTLTVNPFITILSQPQNDTSAVGSVARFSVNAIISGDSYGPLSYQWQLNNQNLTDSNTANAIIRGSNQSELIFTPTSEVPRTSTVRVLVSNPSAGTVISNNATLNVIDPRNILVVEGYTPQNNYDVREVNLDGGINFTLTDTTFGSNFNIITFHASEKDLDLEIEIRTSKGSDRGSYTGGQGGVSRIRTTLRRNDEYTVLGISDNSALFIYRGANLIGVVGEGGDAGFVGNGGSGGGVNNSGENGVGRGAGVGGMRFSTGQLILNGIFGSNSTVTTFFSGDSKSAIPDGGRTITCPKGSYWIGQGILPCANIGTIQFHNTDGTLIPESALINRGFKPGYTIKSTEGRAISTGGNGGGGATGGSGGDEGGGGGGSGYSDGSYSVLSSSLGGNNSLKSTINFKIFVPVPPTVSISIFPSNTIIVNDSATLRWDSTNAISVSISPNIGLPLPLPLSGSRSLVTSSAGSQTYTITATGGESGGTRTASTTLTINSRPPTASISASNTNITQGGSSTISWSTTNATSVNISNIGTVGTSGNTNVSPGSTANYTITASGPGGQATSNVTINVAPPPAPVTATISVTPTTVYVRNFYNLSWSTTGNPSSVRVVASNGSTFSGSTNTSGFVSLPNISDPLSSIPGPVTYTITAVGPTNTSTDSATVNVIDIPPIFGSIQHNTTNDNTTLLNWTTSNPRAIQVVSPQKPTDLIRYYLVVFASNPLTGVTNQSFPRSVTVSNFSIIGAPGFAQPTMRVKSGYPRQVSTNQWDVRFERFDQNLGIYRDNFNSNFTLRVQY